MCFTVCIMCVVVAPDDPATESRFRKVGRAEGTSRSSQHKLSVTHCCYGNRMLILSVVLYIFIVERTQTVNVTVYSV